MNIDAAITLGRKLLSKHGLIDWRFKLDHAKRRFGKCNYTDKIISVSKHIVELNTVAEVSNCILHEIAHAKLTRQHGHGKRWQELAISIGCDGKEHYDPAVINRPPHRWISTCLMCNKTYKAHRIRRRSIYYCPKCRVQLEWRLNENTN